MTELTPKLWTKLMNFYFTWGAGKWEKPEIGTIKKDMGDIFSEWCIEKSNARLLGYVNDIVLKTVMASLKDKYLLVATTTAMQNELYTFQQMYYNKETEVMENQLVKQFYIRFLFNIDEFPQDRIFILDIAATFFNNFIPEVWEFLLLEGV